MMVRSTIGHQFLIRWLVPILQALFLLGGQREVVHRSADGRDQLGVDRSKGSVGDVPPSESAVVKHAESVGVDLPDVGGGFDNAASDEASLLPGQSGGAEGEVEDVVVQARDTTEPINRAGTGFIESSAQVNYYL